MTENAATLHASCVAVAGRAVLIRGASGAGKSGLALQMMALGADLIADDRVQLERRGGILVASCPPAIHGLIEARGIGLLRAAPVPPAQVALVVDLDTAECDRLPPARRVEVAGAELPLLLRVDAPYFAAAVMQYLKEGRRDP